MPRKKNKQQDEAPEVEAVRDALYQLARDAANRLREEADQLGRSIPHYDQRKDQLIRDLPSYPAALAELEKVPVVRALYGDADRILLAFSYGLLHRGMASEMEPSTLDEAWTSFWSELANNVWTYYGVANMQNFDGDASIFELADGVSIRHRSFEELSSLLGGGDAEIDALIEDWMRGGQPASGYVMLAREDLPKREDNVVLSNGPSIDSTIQRTLVGLRLLKTGAVGIGTTFYGRSSSLRLTGGLHMSVARNPSWRIGEGYLLTQAEIPELIAVYEDLKHFTTNHAKDIPNVMLALRRYSSSYERDIGQREDQVVDATIALEALLLSEDEELSFRLAFRGSTILGANEKERLELYRTLREFYVLRSKIVHGVPLNDDQRRLLEELDRLRDIVRKLLRAFMSFAAADEEIRTRGGRSRFYSRLDEALMHETGRAELRAKMALD